MPDSEQQVPSEEPPALVIHNDRAKQELGFRPRPAEMTIVETVESLRDLGLLRTHTRLRFCSLSNLK